MIKKSTFMIMMLLITAYSFSQTVSVDIPINGSAGSAEENFSGSGEVYTGSSDLELYHDGTDEQVVGLYFQNIGLPQNAVITNAYIQFQVDENGAGDVIVNVTGDDTDNASSFVGNAAYGVSSRPSTTANVDWAIASWDGQIGQASTDQRTPDISAILSEITSRSGWAEGNSMVFKFTGVSRSDGAWREAENNSGGTPSLHIEYTAEPSEVVISTVNITANEDDGTAEEAFSGSGFVSTISSDLELYYDGTTEQVVGVRFENINLPQNAVVTNAYVQFEVDENGNGDVTVNVTGDNSDDASVLGSNGNFGLSTRTATTANVDWAIASWVGQIGQASTAQRTPDISAILSEITARSGWEPGNSMAFMFTGVSRSDGAYREASSASVLLHIEYETPPVEIDITGNSISIENGDTTPDLSDFTQFENTGINETLTRTFSITNLGEQDLNLTGSPLVSITGDAEFTILTQPSSSIVSAGGSLDFVVQYAPTAAVTNTATISVASDDADENPYTFSLQATGETAVIDLDVLGNGTLISNGDTTPDVLDHTDFGPTFISIGTTKTYTIANTGNSVITIASIISDNPEFVITNSESTINGGMSSTFNITFVPTSLALSTATITIESNDTDENPFTFNVQGEGEEASFPATITAGDDWFYLNDGSDQGTVWRTLTFDQSNWEEGATEIGYGDGDEVTDLGVPATPRPVTTYFRKYIDMENIGMYNSLDLEAVRDDGIVVYVNNVEVWRNNMPTEGPIAFDDEAITGISGSDEDFWNTQNVNSFPLVEGINIIAVEIHQSSVNSGDISFNFKLTPSTSIAPTIEVERGPYLQSGTPTSVVVKWRTAVETQSAVKYGTALDMLTSVVSNSELTTEHEVTLTGLDPNTTYYYNIGNEDEVLAQSETGDMFIKTAPVAGTDQFVRAWILGDPGTGSINQRNVRDAYYNYVSTVETNTGQTDMMLFLGDNAYSNGTDAQHQSYFFNVYDDMLKKAVAWSCLGNHDGFTSDLETQSGPYYDIFTFPTAAEAGGVASGTEAYYSFDYANIHFIVLDSHQSGREVGGSQYLWAQNDIQNTTQDWIVTLFHHPAYSKGSHDSDWEDRLIEMRENFMPVLEANGVDLVLNGHSHSYERSYFINGHQGFANTFNIDNITNGGHIVGATGDGDGKVDGDGAYQKTSDATEGAVYITAGSSGQISGGDLDHEAMFLSLNQLGSCVMEIESDGNGGQNLTVKFVRDTGAIDDYFTISKTGVTLSVDDNETVEKTIKVFPVPANDLLNIKVNLNEHVTNVKFYNSTGKLVKESDNETINVSNMATGMYVIEIATDKNTYYKSIIIE
ncbi:choice-of-anchor D domain-containing protein [Winogradskyella costae]|uniref:choice-of-anchor D domain-containing protein n=1 Tax=Winogradskyella costae TaxID=2697008 RepID=UPI0015C6FC46|nr:choice-of-anchor D domain-containing protein [Winogradskyella costae]